MSPLRKISLTIVMFVDVALMMLFVFGQTASAEDLYTLGAFSSSSSDDIDLNSVQFHYISNRREHFWPYEQSADTLWDWGFDIYRYIGESGGNDFTGHQFEGLFGWRFSDASYLGGTFGLHRLDVPDNSEQDDQWTYDLRAQFGVTNNFSVMLNAAEDYVYQLGLQPAGIREFLVAQTLEAGLTWNPVRVIRVTGLSSKWDLSDGNVRQEHQARLLYGISPGTPWVWLGVSYEELKYEEMKPDYWTPGRSRSIGLVFESHFVLLKDLAGSLSAGLSKIKEDDNPEGDGGYIFVGVDYNLTETHTLKFVYSRNRSIQQSSQWSENAYSLSLNGSF